VQGVEGGEYLSQRFNFTVSLFWESSFIWPALMGKAFSGPCAGKLDGRPIRGVWFRNTPPGKEAHAAEGKA